MWRIGPLSHPRNLSSKSGVGDVPKAEVDNELALNMAEGEWEPELRPVQLEMLLEDILLALKDVKAAR